MKNHFTDNMTTQRILLALVVWLLPALPSVCQASGLEKTSHASIGRFIDGDTVLVGWIDLSQIDMDGMQSLATNVGIGELPEIPPQVREMQQTLVKLDVTRVYWISSLADAVAGPRAVLIPVKNSRKDTVALLLKSATSNGQSVVVDGNILLAGNDATIEALQETAGPPLDHLIDALAQSDSPHGIIIGASADALQTAAGLMAGQATQDSELTGKVSRLLPSLQSVALHGHLPPTAATLQIQMATDDGASQLATLLNARSAELLKGNAANLLLSANGSTVSLHKDSLEESTDTIRSLVDLFQSARDRPNHKTTMNRHKQIALAMHNFHDVHSRFPPQTLVDEKGKPLHSWRVLILPYLDEANLYKQFRLDEPWNSEHNIKLATQMPDLFRSPDDSAEMTAAGKTRFVAPLTNNSTFGRLGEGVRISDITDGSSNTLMVVQTAQQNAVIWTKPDDLVLTEDRPLFEQIAGDADEFTACSCDGATHFLNRNVTEEALRGLVSMNGGEIVEWP